MDKQSYTCRQNNANLFYSMATSPIYHYISPCLVQINRCFLFFKEHIVNLCPYLFGFFSVNFTSIIVLYKSTHISLILLNTEFFLICILLVSVGFFNVRQCNYILHVLEVRFQGYRFYRLIKKKSYICMCRQNNAILFYSMAASPIYHYISPPQVYY